MSSNASLKCPCGTQKIYSHCCEIIHQNPSKALHPEPLMRARYSAYVLGLIDFIIQTYHPSCEAEKQRESIQEAIKSQWQKLEVLNSSVEENAKEGYVEFKAFFIDAHQTQCLHEKSRFLLEQQKGEYMWFYLDGIYPKTDKIGRNDPCICGSQRKFKKCCG